MSKPMDIEVRMKTYYEGISQIYLTRRTPVIVRIDGKGFKNITKQFDTPFDEKFRGAMLNTARDLLRNIQGCVFAYTQSDEISLFLKDYETFSTAAYFEYNIQKLASITASMTTMYFNKYIGVYKAKQYQKVAGNCMFDSRVFNIPKEEVTNYFYWRQLDCRRNAISAIARGHFTKTEMRGLTCSKAEEKLLQEFGVDVGNYEAKYLNGQYVLRRPGDYKAVCGTAPIFYGADRSVIEDIIV